MEGEDCFPPTLSTCQSDEDITLHAKEETCKKRRCASSRKRETEIKSLYHQSLNFRKTALILLAS